MNIALAKFTEVCNVKKNCYIEFIFIKILLLHLYENFNPVKFIDYTTYNVDINLYRNSEENVYFEPACVKDSNTIGF